MDSLAVFGNIRGRRQERCGDERQKCLFMFHVDFSLFLPRLISKPRAKALVRSDIAAIKSCRLANYANSAAKTVQPVRLTGMICSSFSWNANGFVARSPRLDLSKLRAYSRL